MKFSPALVPARLIKRYKRFLADVELSDGSITTVHCPNTGSMRGCAEPGARIWLSHSANPKRKYAYTWQLIEPLAGGIICIHSALANRLVHEALTAGVISEAAHYEWLESEVRYGEEKSRVDFVAHFASHRLFIEVKAVTLLEREGLGLFPDAVSARGARHLRELQLVRQRGDRAMLLYLVLHSEIESVAPARQVDPKYCAALDSAIASGVEVSCYGCAISAQEIRVTQPLRFLDQPIIPGIVTRP